MEIILPQLGLFFWTSVIFLGFFVIMRRFAWKPIITALREREDSIENSLLEAQKAREEMSKLQSDNQALLKEAMLERDKMLKEANKMRDEIVGKAKKEAETAAKRELEKAKEQINSEKNAALTEIKNTAGTLAVDIAEKLLRKQFENRDSQEDMANKLIGDLSNN